MTVSDHGSVSNVRHDLLTPINHLLGYSEMMLENCEGQGLHELVGELETIRSVSKELMNAIHQALPSGLPGVEVELDKVKFLLDAPLARIFRSIDSATAAIPPMNDFSGAEDLAKIRIAAER